VLSACIALVACSADADDFRASAERFIESDSMTDQAGTTFTNAVCEQPDSTEVGTGFGCTALDAAGTTWQFDVTIVDDTNFQITGRQQP
jgi:hypothetical protein